MHGDWQTFFLAQVGASAALTGLVFVALSINLSDIMQNQTLVERAGEAMLLLVTPVIIGLTVLTPYSMQVRGAIAAIVAIVAWGAVTRFLVKGAASGDRPKQEFAFRVATAELATFPAVVGAIVLLAGSSTGFAFLGFGAVLSIGVGILDGWVLSVEILR